MAGDTRALPEFNGVSYDTLQQVLTENGFVAQRVDEASEDVEAGYVLRYQDHQAGDSLAYGSTVTVVVSSGPPRPRNKGEGVALCRTCLRKS